MAVPYYKQYQARHKPGKRRWMSLAKYEGRPALVQECLHSNLVNQRLDRQLTVKQGAGDAYPAPAGEAYPEPEVGEAYPAPESEPTPQPTWAPRPMPTEPAERLSTDLGTD